MQTGSIEKTNETSYERPLFPQIATVCLLQQRFTMNADHTTNAHKHQSTKKKLNPFGHLGTQIDAFMCKYKCTFDLDPSMRREVSPEVI